MSQIPEYKQILLLLKQTDLKHSQTINAVKSIIVKQHEIKSNAVINYFKN